MQQFQAVSLQMGVIPNSLNLGLIDSQVQTTKLIIPLPDKTFRYRPFPIRGAPPKSSIKNRKS
jgi:hypothetical protein